MVVTRSGNKETINNNTKHQKKQAGKKTKGPKTTMASNFFDNIVNVWKGLTEIKELVALFTSLGQLSVTRFDYNGFDAKQILEVMRQKALAKKTTKTEFFQDVTDLVIIGISRGNIRMDQVAKTVEGDGQARIKELSEKYGIYLKPHARSLHALAGNELSFTRAISLFPHIASALQFNCPNLAREGSQTVLSAKELPACMKHTGFSALIPSTLASEVKSIFLMASIAYMIEFSRMINPKVRNTTILDLYNQQRTFCLTAHEKSLYDDNLRVDYFVAFELHTAENFRKVCNVAARVMKERQGEDIVVQEVMDRHVKDNVVVYKADAASQLIAANNTKLIQDAIKIQDLAVVTHQGNAQPTPQASVRVISGP